MQGRTGRTWATLQGANMANATKQTATPPTQFYRLPQLTQRLGVSGSSIWVWVKAGKFPKPVKLSANVTAWNAADVEAWAQSRIVSSQKVEV